jgi:hypothetical protein
MATTMFQGVPPRVPRVKVVCTEPSKKCTDCRFYQSHTNKCTIFYKPVAMIRASGAPCGPGGCVNFLVDRIKSKHDRTVLCRYYFIPKKVTVFPDVSTLFLDVDQE